MILIFPLKIQIAHKKRANFIIDYFGQVKQWKQKRDC